MVLNINILIPLLQFCFGGLLLFFGADYLIDSSKKIAEKFKISKIIIGISIVAIGTSLPELIVSIMAMFQEKPGIVLGNVIGSNIANIGLILGICSIINPLYYSFSKLKGDLIFLIIITVLPIISINFDYMNRLTGILYLVILCVYCFYLIMTNNQIDSDESTNSNHVILYLVLGILGLGIGSQLFVKGAVGIAEILGISSIIIGMTIVAIGTSIPELATTLLAVKRNESSLAIGNVIGSNIMNIVVVLGISFIIKEIHSFSSTINVQLFIMFLLTSLLFISLYISNKLSRSTGLVFLIIYSCFIFINIKTAIS